MKKERKKPSMDLRISGSRDSGRSIVGEVIQQSTVRDPWGTRASFLRGFISFFIFHFGVVRPGDRDRPIDGDPSENERDEKW